MFVDESGDPGVTQTVRHVTLSYRQLTFHELRWKQLLQDLVAIQTPFTGNNRFELREEIHATDFVNSPGDLKANKKTFKNRHIEAVYRLGCFKFRYFGYNGLYR